MAGDRSLDWYHQALDDLSWAEDSLKTGHYAQTCFIAQQVGEKGVKALALRRGYSQVKSHSILEIARALKVNGELETIAKRLDQYYIATRYPDALPMGAPYEFYTAEQAEEAVRFARRLLEIVSTLL